MCFKLASGVNVPDLSGIAQGYCVRLNDMLTSITVNISREHLETVFLTLARLVLTPAFMVIEHPVSSRGKKLIKKIDKKKLAADPYPKAIYYRDDLDFDSFPEIWQTIRRHCLDDGATTFGFASHKGYDKVYVSRYKIARIDTAQPYKYLIALDELGFKKTDNLITVQDILSDKNPGSTISVEIDGKSIFEQVETLKNMGFYLAEHRDA